MQERPELKAFLELLEEASMQFKYTEKMEVLSQGRDAAGRLERVGTREPIHLHPLCLSSLSVSCLHVSYWGPASSACCPWW